MFKRLTVLLLLMVTAMGMYAQSAAIKSLYRKVNNNTYETKADSMTNAFIESFMIKSKGVFNDKYGYYAFNAYWTQAHAMDVVIYNYQRQKNINRTLASKYLNYIRLWYKNKANNYSGAAAATSTTPNTTNGYKMFENPYTDDMCWITLTLLHIGEATGTSSYSIIARQVFDNYIIKRAHETEDSTGLWLPWNTDAGSGPNACTQAPATLIAAKLYKKYGTEKYLTYAKKLYTYTAENIVKSDGRVEEPPLTYTQGTFAEACRILYHVTDESTSMKNKYKSLAFTYLNYAFTSGRCTSGNNILRHEGTSGDQSIFKAVLIPYAVNYVLDEDMSSTNRGKIFDYLKTNTTTMWKNLDLSRYTIVFCNYDWRYAYTGADSDASMGAMCSGSSLVENYARMCRAIVDRYDLGALYTECSNLVIEPGHEDDVELAPFNTAMAAAKEIIDNPNDYMPYQFLQAIENLQAAYQTAVDYTTGIESIHNSQFTIDNSTYNLSGQKVSGKLQKGIYIKGGRKVLIE